MPTLYLLTAPPTNWDADVIYSGMSGWPCFKKIEAAGRPYEEFLAKRYNKKPDVEDKKRGGGRRRR